MNLTKRERQVIDGWCEGLTNDEIAEVMRVPKRAVDGIGHRMLPKLGATSPRHACAIWARSDLSDVPAGEITGLAERIAEEAMRIARGMLK